MDTKEWTPGVDKDQVYRALGLIVENQKEKSLNWCVDYAKYGLTIDDDHELKTQCLYVLNNMTHWRGPVAFQVRSTLKAYCGLSIER
jgi:predicted secreted hydrolase